MRFRLTAFVLHLCASAGVLTLIVGWMYLGWYRWPGWYLSGVIHVVGIVVLVDVVIGPTLTLIIANPAKSRSELTRDLAIIVSVQLAALVYGATALWEGRPLYYTFSADRLEFVRASDIDPAETALAQEKNPARAPYWYSLPRWVWAPLPDDPNEAVKIVQSTTLGVGKDVIDMPRYFKPWDQGLPKLREQLLPVDQIKYLSAAEKQSLRQRIAALGVTPADHNALIMWGGSRRLVAVVNAKTLQIRAFLIP